MTENIALDGAEPVRLTVAGVLRHMADAVRARGKYYVYQPPVTDSDVTSWGEVCIYVHDGCPSCLIGVVLHLAGVPLPELYRRNDILIDELLDLLEAARVVTAEDGVAVVLLAAQHVQDGYHSPGSPGTWGEALAAAREAAASIGTVS